MKKRLIISIIAMITVLLMLSACGADEITAPQDTTIPQDTTTVDVISIETTPADDISFTNEQFYITAGVAYEGTLQGLLESRDPGDRIGAIMIADGSLVRAFAINSADKKEITASFFSNQGWKIQNKEIDFAKYDEAYFKHNYLLLVHIHTGSTSNKFNVEALNYDEFSVSMNIAQYSLSNGGYANTTVGNYLYVFEIPVQYYRQMVKYSFTNQ